MERQGVREFAVERFATSTIVGQVVDVLDQVRPRHG
jgi:hypothetical protein